MGVRILVDATSYAGVINTCLYDSVTDWAFGPVMNSAEEAEAFIAWLPGDARLYEDSLLESKYTEFLSEVWDAENDCPRVREQEETS